jgi:hypothetical protein
MAAMYSDRFTGAAGAFAGAVSSGVSLVERSTIHLASWVGSRGRLPFPTIMVLNRSQRRKSKVANATRGFWIIFAALMVISVITIALYAFLVRGAR